MFPVWLRFKGGKGVATAFGVFVALCWPAALSALALWGAVVALTRYVSLAPILAAVVLPFLTLSLSPGKNGYVSGAAMFACCWLVIVKHRANIVRLLQGTEHRFEPYCHCRKRFLGNCAGPEPGSARGSLHYPVVSFGAGGNLPSRLLHSSSGASDDRSGLRSPGRNIVISAVPSQHVRTTYER